MAGYGNRTDTAERDLTEAHSGTRLGIDHSEPYHGGHDTYKSGTVGGAGSGNKLDSASSGGDGSALSQQHSDTRYDVTHGEPYSGGHEKYKSGTVGGAGAGNKTSGPKTGNVRGYDHVLMRDSTSGKLLEKLGEVTHNESLAAKGTERREQFKTGED